MYPLSHKEIIDMLFAEYPNVATTAAYYVFCGKIERDQIEKDNMIEEVVDVLDSECRKAFEAGFKAALAMMI